MALETLRVRRDGAVLFAEIAAPPMNLLGPELVRDLVLLIQRAEADTNVQLLVFVSADPDYFISHVDVTRIAEYRQEAAKLVGDLDRFEGRVRGAGSEFVLACDMRFAARESAIFSQLAQGFGLIPGAGGIQHLTRLLGRARTLEVILSAEDYDAALAERYGWINRAMPAGDPCEWVRSLAHRVARFPSVGRAALKNRVNAIALAPADDFRRDSDLFLECASDPESQRRTGVAMSRGFQTHDGEMALAKMLATLVDR